MHAHASVPPAANARPIFILGAGAIVRDAHLPAYELGALEVGGFFDLDHARAQEMAAKCAGARVFDSLPAFTAACTAAHGIYDIALPPSALAEVLAALPTGSIALLQKPLGHSLAHASELMRVAQSRDIRGAVNFQLRHAPAVVALRALLDSNAIGTPIDFEARVVCTMPWESWKFLEGMPRMEITMHSIHYLDLARALFGEPERVWSAIAKHPNSPKIAEARSTTILKFANEARGVVTTYHHHAAPHGHDASHLKIEGTHGTAVVRMGVNLDYPRGRADTLEWSANGGAWQSIALEGNWFPHAFLGSMRALQAFATGGTTALTSNFQDAWRTMALVETCYASASHGEIIPEPPAHF
jgi:predicted dehydrogenase